MNWIKRWIAKAAYDGLNQTQQGIAETRTNKLHDMFNGCIPAMVAFKIDNGYVVRAMDAEQAYVGGRVGGFTFCKDHAEIAEHIVASEAKRKLGVRDMEYQQEMFAAEKARAVAMQGGLVGQAKRATNRI